MRDTLNHIVANPAGTLVLLLLAAFFEAYGDSWFQTALHRSSGLSRVVSCVAGALALILYGVIVNSPRWEFGKLLGVYVVLFFLLAQVFAWLRFHQRPTPPILLGGSLIVAGGIVISFWTR